MSPLTSGRDGGVYFDRLGLKGLEMVRGVAYMWEFEVKPDSVDAFVRLYGPGGEWVRLFSNAEGYIKTELHHDVHQPSRFVTIDYWESTAHLERFRRDFAAEFAKIDGEGETLTVSEHFIGEFTYTS